MLSLVGRHTPLSYLRVLRHVSVIQDNPVLAIITAFTAKEQEFESSGTLAAAAAAAEHVYTGCGRSVIAMDRHCFSQHGQLVIW